MNELNRLKKFNLTLITVTIGALVTLPSLALARVSAEQLASKIQIEINDTIVEMRKDAVGFIGLTTEAVPEDLPAEVSCVSQVLSPTLKNGKFILERCDYSSNDDHSTAFVRQINNLTYGLPKDKTCSIKYLVSFPEAQKKYYAYRDITTSVDLDRIVKANLGPKFGLGMFGEVLGIMTVGLSDLMIDSANNIKDALERSISNALSRKVAVQDIVTSLSLILCAAEAANLANMACEHSAVADHTAHINKVRHAYLNFISEYSGSTKSKSMTQAEIDNRE